MFSTRSFCSSSFICTASCPLNPVLCKWKLCWPPTGKASLNQWDFSSLEHSLTASSLVATAGLQHWHIRSLAGCKIEQTSNIFQSFILESYKKGLVHGKNEGRRWRPEASSHPCRAMRNSHHSTQLRVLKLQYCKGIWSDAERVITPCHAISNPSWRLPAGGKQIEAFIKEDRERLNQQQSWPFSERLLSAATLPDENERCEWNLGRKERGELWKGKTKHLPDRGSPGLSRLQHNGDGGVSLVQGGVGVVFWHRWRCGRTKSNALVIRQLLPLVVMAT